MTVKIGYEDYSVVFKPSIIHNGEAVDGLHDSETSEIEIAEKLSPRRKKQRLLHEAIHGMEVIYNIDELTEEQVDTLAMGVLSFIWDNPELIKKIQKKDEPLE